jgi:hypothetical protein
MAKSYDTYINDLHELSDGKEYKILIRDLTPGRTKYISRYVKALVSTSSENLAGADVLWIRFPVGIQHPEPWAIKILEELGEYKPYEPQKQFVSEGK